MEELFEEIYGSEPFAPGSDADKVRAHCQKLEKEREEMEQQVRRGPADDASFTREQHVAALAALQTKVRCALFFHAPTRRRTKRSSPQLDVQVQRNAVLERNLSAVYSTAKKEMAAKDAVIEVQQAPSRAPRSPLTAAQALVQQQQKQADAGPDSPQSAALSRKPAASAAAAASVPRARQAPATKKRAAAASPADEGTAARSRNSAATTKRRSA